MPRPDYTAFLLNYKYKLLADVWQKDLSLVSLTFFVVFTLESMLFNNVTIQILSSDITALVSV